ncbi:MAG: winged helix-turn-helix domain-containing protein [Thaumarchaeota archaeon]|nr:winged helix-turn-helix domain-containing protein [Nitrososphaerota archaeon]
MTSFKLAALKILRDANEPLHYEEITKRALDQNLIETSGATPEFTMNAQITRDIKYKKEKSFFKRSKPGIFTINPNYTEKEEIHEEKEETEEELETTSTQYVGKAGEHLVVSELLFRGYNATIMSVDEGLDIVATKSDRLFNIQVKTSNENKFNKYVSDIRISSFEKYNKNNTFYIFVLKGKETNFLILPYFEIQKNIDQENILVVNKNTRYRANISIRDNKLYLGNMQNDMSYYRNNWDLIK